MFSVVTVIRALILVMILVPRDMQSRYLGYGELWIRVDGSKLNDLSKLYR